MNLSVESVESLQVRIAQIERELFEIRQQLAQFTGSTATPEASWRQKFQWTDRVSWQAWLESWFEDMNLTIAPIGPEKLQAMMRQEGVRPEDNLLSSGIIAMREE